MRGQGEGWVSGGGAQLQELHEFVRRKLAEQLHVTETTVRCEKGKRCIQHNNSEQETKA
jgi:hypothetical protein